MISIDPILDRIIVQRTEDYTGLVARTVKRDQKPLRGKIVAAGPGRPLDDGTLQPLDVRVGDEIIFSSHVGTQIKHGGVDYLLMREEDVWAVL